MVIYCDEIISLEPFIIIRDGAKISHNELLNFYEITTLVHNKNSHRREKRKWQKSQEQSQV